MRSPAGNRRDASWLFPCWKASWAPPGNRAACWRLSAGWLVQAWFDLGVSGGTFSGQNLPAVGFPPIQNVFGGADDANIMGFDGVFVRAEYNF